MSLKEIVILKINSLYILNDDKKQEFINLINNADYHTLEKLDRKLDLILLKMWNLTQKLIEKYPSTINLNLYSI